MKQKDVCEKRENKEVEDEKKTKLKCRKKLFNSKE